RRMKQSDPASQPLAHLIAAVESSWRRGALGTEGNDSVRQMSFPVSAVRHRDFPSPWDGWHVMLDQAGRDTPPVGDDGADLEQGTGGILTGAPGKRVHAVAHDGTD